MNDYEKMSEEMNEAQKSRIMKAEPIKPNQQEQFEQKENDYTFAGFMGIIFIIISIVGAIGIILSFDWDHYSWLKERSSLYDAEQAIMKAELTTTWITAGATLLGNLAIGSVLLALDKIIQLLRKK